MRLQVLLQRQSGYTLANKATAGRGVFEPVSFVVAASGTIINPNVAIMDYRTSGWTEVQAKYILLLDLTAVFGSGNEPTAAVMDAYLARWANGWFDGTVNLALQPRQFGEIGQRNGGITLQGVEDLSVAVIKHIQLQTAGSTPENCKKQP